MSKFLATFEHTHSFRLVMLFVVGELFRGGPEQNHRGDLQDFTPRPVTGEGDKGSSVAHRILKHESLNFFNIKSKGRLSAMKAFRSLEHENGFRLKSQLQVLISRPTQQFWNFSHFLH
jgi:hypothetical protein